MKRGSDILIGALVLLGALYVRAQDPVPIQALRNLAFDTYQRIEPRTWSPDFQVRIGAIDEPALDRYGQWPWSRAALADITRRLTELGAAAIAFDVIFAEPDRTAPKALIASLPEAPAYALARQEISRLPDPDLQFAQALARAPAVLAFTWLNGSEGVDPPAIPEKFGVSVIGADLAPQDYVAGGESALTPLPELMAAAPGLGEVHAGLPDPDGIIRKVPMVARVQGRLYTNLAAESLRLALGGQTAQVKTSTGSGEFWKTTIPGIAAMRVGEAIIPVNVNGELLLYDSGSLAERYFSLADVMRQDFDPGIVQGNHPIGATVEGLKDIRATPNAPVIPGVEIHAQVLEQILSGTYLNRPYWASFVEGGFLLGFGLVLLAALRRRSAIPGLAVALFALAAGLAGSWWAFKSKGFLFDPVYPALIVVILFLGGTLTNFLRTEREKRQVRNAFSRYLSPVLVDQLSEHPEQLRLGGEMRELTVMFSDIRGFTSIAESLDPQTLTQFINSYLTPMTGIIQANEGTIDKYIGDCVMAFWNAP
jgi:adenylate cyclase